MKAVIKIKIPKARVKYTNAIKEAMNQSGEWVLYREMVGTSALQSARKMNTPYVEGDIDGLVFGVGEDGNLYVQFRG